MKILHVKGLLTLFTAIYSVLQLQFVYILCATHGQIFHFIKMHYLLGCTFVELDVRAHFVHWLKIGQLGM